MSLLPVDLTAGVSTGHVAHHEELHRIAVAQTQFNVESYPDATFDLRQAAALADAEAAGGVLVYLPGTYSTAGLGTIQKPHTSLWAPGGSAATIFTYTGSGDCLRVEPSPFTVTQMGSLRGFTIRGNANAGAIGVHEVDTGTTMAYDDVVIENFTGVGAVGLCLQNSAPAVSGTPDAWNERANGNRLHLNHNTIGMQLIGSGDNSSFAYHRWLDLRFNLADNQIGVQAKGTAHIYNGLWHVLVNADGTNAILFDFADTASIDGWGVITGEVNPANNLTFRRMGATTTWALSGYFSVHYATDGGTTERVLSPVEIDRNGRTHHRWPALGTIAIEAGAGTSPPTPLLTGNDTGYVVTWGTGTSPTFGDQFTITFYEAFRSPPIVTVTPFGRPTAAFKPYLAAVSATEVTIGLTDAPDASQPNSTYGVVLTVHA